MASKAELVAHVANSVGIGKAEAERAINAVFDCITTEVKADRKVSIPSFGTFSRSERAARMGRNPRTGEALQIKASRSVKFSVSSNLKKDLSAGMMM